MRPPMDPRTGDPEAPLRVGEWLLGAPLHGGGSAVLNLCRRAGESVDRYVLKRPPADAAWPLAARLAQEGALLRRLSHRHIVALVDAGTAEDGRPYLVLPRLEGETLACSALSTPALLQLGVQLAEALAHAHARGIAHRDLKPENVLVSAGGQATLIDLGVGWAADAGEGLSGEGQGPGTPRYMPPERLVGRPEDPRPGDVYALGVVLWERLSARLAFAELAPADLLAAKRAGPLPALSGQPEALVALLQRMSAPEAEARPSAAAVSQALSALLPAVTEGPGSTPWMQTAAGPEQAAPAAPRQLDRFTLLQELGRGGMGVVYRAWDPLRRQEVALKTASSSSQRGLRLQREVRALSRLTHPAIVRTLDAGEVGGAPYYTMELVEGPTLRALIAGGPQPPRRATAWVLALAEGLQHAHEQGVIHRDVKPENVLMAEGKEPRLSDFGLARQLDPESHALTRTGELLGTPLYMAPEQIEGGPVDARADVYALGAVLYELLCGQPPHPPDHPARLLHSILTRTPPPPSARQEGVPPELDAICLRALARDPGERYPDMAALAADLRRSMAGEALDPVTRPRRWGRAGWLAALAGLLLLSLGGAWALGGWSRGQRERAAAAHLADVEAQITQLLAAGEFAQADQAFEAYAASEAAQQTLALSEGWLHQAARLATRGEAAELTALARAYESAVGPEQIVDALLATADALRRRGRWLDLAAVATLLAERAPEAVQASPEALALLAEGRVIRRDFSQPEGEVAPLLEAIRRAHRTAHEVTSAKGVAAEGRRELLIREPDGTHTLLSTEDLSFPVLAPLMDSGDVSMQPLPDHRLLMINQDEASIHRLGPAGLEGEPLWDGLDVSSVSPSQEEGRFIIGRLDGRLEGLDLNTGALRPLHPPTSEARSAITFAATADLDGDGAEELVVTASQWRAFDVRLLSPDPGGPHAFALRGREKLGQVRNGVVLRGAQGATVVLNKASAWGSRVLFPAETPYGAPRGLYALRWDGAEMRVAPILLSELQCGEVWAGDIDGDGLDDLAARCESDGVLLRQLPGGDFAPAVLSGVWIRGLADVDGDGDAEVLVALSKQDSPMWVLGAGEDALPVLPAQALEDAPHPALTRATDLARLGLVDPAVAQLQSLAVVDASLRGEALLQSARLLSADTQHARAEWMYLQAAAVLPTSGR
ncbi:MAG: serine/threonine protein kinase, partial [Alphaproteobacteria bacterium]|nr:serine/threonine protein kinase [Alphaproteobacteria bacterium]